jgi:simple sugar transport system permease protein
MAGWLKARRGVDEVISTIMLNFVALEIVSWAVHGPLMEASRAYPTSEPIAPSAELYTFFSPTRLNAGMILAVVLAIFCYHLLFFTEAGFKLRAFGKSRRASAFFGIGAGGLTIATMAFSGALAGLGGAVQLSAINHRLYERFSPGWGFEAIAVALVARLNPLGILLSALLFGALDNGAQAMQRSVGVSPVLVQVIQGMVIFVLLAFDAAGLSELRQKIFSPASPQASTAALTGDAANA